MSITSKQWMKICFDGLGLRSAKSPEDLNGASYAMDDGAIGMAALRGAPDGWEAKLDATLDYISNFPDSGGRYLLLVKGVRGTSADYGGAFTKCSSHANGVIAYTELSGTTRSSLREWVLSRIPE